MQLPRKPWHFINKHDFIKPSPFGCKLCLNNKLKWCTKDSVTMNLVLVTFATIKRWVIFHSDSTKKVRQIRNAHDNRILKKKAIHVATCKCIERRRRVHYQALPLYSESLRIFLFRMLMIIVCADLSTNGAYWLVRSSIKHCQTFEIHWALWLVMWSLDHRGEYIYFPDVRSMKMIMYDGNAFVILPPY